MVERGRCIERSLLGMGLLLFALPGVAFAAPEAGLSYKAEVVLAMFCGLLLWGAAFVGYRRGYEWLLDKGMPVTPAIQFAVGLMILVTLTIAFGVWEYLSPHSWAPYVWGADVLIGAALILLALLTRRRHTE